MLTLESQYGLVGYRSTTRVYKTPVIHRSPPLKKKTPPTIVVNFVPKLIYLDHNRNYPYVAIIEESNNKETESL